MTVRDALGMIYVCGYNGENGWGSIDTSIFDHDADDATLMANSNYHKYVATQALIWEITNDTTYYSRSSAVQGEIDVLRSRIRNYQNREARAANATGSISVYKSASEAQAHAYGATSVESGVGHFAYGYNSYYNPTNFIEETNWNIVTNKTASDFTTSIVDKKITLGWTRVYGSSAEVGQSGQTIYNLDDNDASNLWGVVLWRPDNGNQLTISATATSDKVYASFVFDFQRETYQAAATFNTVKVDEQGNPSRGATFTVYKADGSAFGTMTDANKDGHYSFSVPRTEFADEDSHYYDSDNNGKPITTPINKTYTVKETSPATEVYINGAWQKATFAANNTTYTISISINRSTGKMTWTAAGTNGGSADRSGRTTAGNISFGSASQNGKTVNYQLVSADADFTIKKVDELGLEAKGATFGVYTDPDCTSNSFITLTDPDGDGIFTSSVLSWKDQLKSSGAKTQVLYIKERTPATQVKINGKWVDATCELDPSVKTLRIVWNPADGNIYEELYDGAVTDFKSTKPKITKSGTFDGSKSTVHADFTSDPWVNVPYVYAKADLTIKKVDNQGRQARGAEFTVYSDEACTKKVGTMNDKSKDGIYSYENISFTKKLRNVNTAQSLTYYVKETKPATEILFDGKWIAIDCKLDSKVQKITITWTPSNGSVKAVLSKDDEKDITVNGAFDEKTLTSTVHADFTGRPVVNPITSTGSMKIEKYDAETGERLTGATFRVYCDQNDNGLYDSPDTVYLEASTDEDGDGIYLLEGMPLDTSYLVIETEAPEYYETDPNYYSFKLTPGKRDVTVDNVTWKVVEGVPGEFLNHNPIIGTTLVDKETEEHVTVVREKITLIDTVEYNGLHVGEKYVMTGTLYDRITGDPILDVNGNPITSSVTFVPEKVFGTVEVPFEINTEIARNKTIVAGEKVRHEESEKWVGIHFDLKDQGQTVFVPDLHTTLTDKNTEDHVAADEKVELIDVVSYKNLVPGLEYTVVGKLMDKKTGESLKDKDGNEISSSVTFTPEKREGTVEVVFSFTREIAEDTVLVAFEDLYYKDVLVVSHADIGDVDQTVYFPKIRTTLVGECTKEHVVPQRIRTKDFFDCIFPGVIKFVSDYYICGNTYNCVWAVKGYPPSTDALALLSQLSDKEGVTIKMYLRLVEAMEQRKIIQDAARKNTMQSTSNDVNETISANENLQDVVEMLSNLRKNKEPLLHTAVYIGLTARSLDELKDRQSDVDMELQRSHIEVDKLSLRQLEGFMCVLPVGFNMFGDQYERVLPASSVANLFPFNFSGKTDPHGNFLGKDKYGTNILVDFDRRAEDKTTSNILILGNSGQGKSYLMKLILTNIRESGRNDVEEETMNSVLTKKGLNEQIKEALDFINEHKTLKALLIILLTVATCNAVYEVGARFGRFLYLIMH